LRIYFILRLGEDLGGFIIKRLSEVETDVETGYGGKEIKTLSALGPRDYILSLVNRKNSMESWVWEGQSIAW
jgi:hypothetical protein